MEDKYTIASHLQRKLNDVKLPVRVVNNSNWRDLYKSCSQIVSPKYVFNKDDFIVVVTHNFKKELLEEIKDFSDKEFFTWVDLTEKFERPHRYGEIFFDTHHLNSKGYELIADNILSIVTPTLRKNLDTSSLASINEYFSSHGLKKLPYERIGSIIMNCNPYTKGHDFLIKYALSQVDFLYIFVVEEDKSFFPLKDRINIVKENLKDYKNIKVIPSGTFMISASTLPQYFKKDELQDAKLDYTLDLDLFCKFIAPRLNITHRFAGSEPNCKITKQYNDAMSQILPKYGIRFVEIARNKIESVPISASLVRKSLTDLNLKNIKSLVPKKTYYYLFENGYIKNTLLDKLKLPPNMKNFLFKLFY